MVAGWVCAVHVPPGASIGTFSVLENLDGHSDSRCITNSHPGPSKCLAPDLVGLEAVHAAEVIEQNRATKAVTSAGVVDAWILRLSEWPEWKQQ